MRALLFAALLLPALGAQAQERVLQFHSQILVKPGDELVVNERIEIQAEGKQIRRGILRDFPTAYLDRYGTHVKVPFDVLSVSLDGGSVDWRTEPMENGVRIRIGNPNVRLARGRHVYEILYRTGRQIGFFEQHDELYWNVNGNGWTFPFDAISAEVELPARVAASQLRLEAYTGYFGARGRHYEAAATENGATFRATRALAAGEGLTIVVGFPKGLVAEPTTAQRVQRWLGDNRGAVAGLTGFFVMSAFLWFGWSLVGRDPREGPRFPRYEPPPGVGPAGVRFVDRMQFDPRCMVAALLGLGQRGFLKIRQHGGSYEIERTGSEPAEWLPGERALRGMLPAPGATLRLGVEHDPSVQAAVAGFQRELNITVGGKNFSTNRAWVVIALLIAALTVWIMFGLDAGLLVIAVAGAAMLAVLVLFWKWLPAYSIQGRKLQDHVEGLKQYLSIAEKDELARIKAPPQTREEFARLLPYAVALDVENAWAGRFASLIGAAAVAQAAADYYSRSDTDSGDRFGGSSFGDSIAGMGSAISAASTPPGSSSGFSDSGGSSGSSGGGGGGSSGGGGGGGGGSGW